MPDWRGFDRPPPLLFLLALPVSKCELVVPSVSARRLHQVA
jgi:hypothetical protein